VFYVAAPVLHNKDDNSIGIISSTILEVKDFNWLRNGIPSPNFRIEAAAVAAAAAAAVHPLMQFCNEKKLDTSPHVPGKTSSSITDAIPNGHHNQLEQQQQQLELSAAVCDDEIVIMKISPQSENSDDDEL